MTRRRWIVLLVLVIAAAAWFGWKATHRPDPAAAYTTQVDRHRRPERGHHRQRRHQPGPRRQRRHAGVGDGRQTERRLQQPRRPSAQVLCELDPSVYAARLAASEATLANITSSLALTRANAARSAELFKQNYISRQDYRDDAADRRERRGAGRRGRSADQAGPHQPRLHDHPLAGVGGRHQPPGRPRPDRRGVVQHADAVHHRARPDRDADRGGGRRGRRRQGPHRPGGQLHRRRLRPAAPSPAPSARSGSTRRRSRTSSPIRSSSASPTPTARCCRG